MPTAVITGAARGLGRAIATTLAAKGYGVHLTDVDGEAAVAAAAELGARASASALDVRDGAACDALARELAERQGGLDLWVNNAGIVATGKSWEQSDEIRRAMLEVNTIGTMNGTLAALAPMRRAGRGHVVNIISLAGIVAAPGEVAYSASKHAAIAFTFGTLFDLRRDGITDIHLSAVCPDGIWTPMLHELLDDPAAAGSFSGTLLTPEQVAAKVGELVDRPRPLLTVPRWRGFTLRLIDLFPALGARLVGPIMRNAERRQRRYRKLIESGRWPPKSG
jgi:NAD(P)-dependent dehydrogenase (short-subunit alcohol dehydrogenase family)